jgi:AraC family transcriptional regulator
MDYIKVLSNGNRIVNSTIPAKSVSQTTSRFTMRFVFGGSELCAVGRRQLSIHNDSFIVLNKDTRFTSDFGILMPESVFAIEFDEEFMNDFNHENLVINDDGDATSLQPELIETIYPFKMEMKHAIGKLKEYLENGGSDEQQLNEYLTRCLISYYRIYNDEILNKAQNLNFLHYSTKVEILRRLNLAKEYLYANYNRNVNLDILADHACLSVNHLLRTFKLAYDQSPHQFLIQLRLQRAQLLLTKTEYPIYEIVNMVGFKCTSSFIRLFRTRYKTTPLKYRNVIAA